MTSAWSSHSVVAPSTSVKRNVTGSVVACVTRPDWQSSWCFRTRVAGNPLSPKSRGPPPSAGAQPDRHRDPGRGDAATQRRTICRRLPDPGLRL
jgi:hypothetical protein